MKRFDLWSSFTKILTFISLSIFPLNFVRTQTIAIFGTEGFGHLTQGERSGDVYYVPNLEEYINSLVKH